MGKYTTRPCVYERTQQVRLGSPGWKNGAASSRRVQNSAGIPGVSSPMGNNEDSASFITTCSSIPDLTARAPTNGRLNPRGSLPLRARERDESNAPGVYLALESLRRDTCTPPTPPHHSPLFSAGFPTDARDTRLLPRKCSRLGYSEPGDGI